MGRWIFAGRHDRFCHAGPVEVIPNLYCGSLKESLVMASEEIRVDTLIPLDSLAPDIWELGFRGEILYYPTDDYGTLPDDVLGELVDRILERLKAGKKVGLFCLGGHGRTGYVASVVLGKLGYDDPIGYLRSHYCHSAVESDAQIRHIAEVLEKPELAAWYLPQNQRDSLLFSPFGYLQNYGFGEEYVDADVLPVTCGSCVLRIEGVCQLYREQVEEDEPACEEFLEKE